MRQPFTKVVNLPVSKRYVGSIDFSIKSTSVENASASVDEVFEEIEQILEAKGFHVYSFLGLDEDKPM